MGQVHAALMGDLPGLCTLVVPFQACRAGEAVDSLRGLGLVACLWSDGWDACGCMWKGSVGLGLGMWVHGCVCCEFLLQGRVSLIHITPPPAPFPSDVLALCRVTWATLCYFLASVMHSTSPPSPFLVVTAGRDCDTVVVDDPGQLPLLYRWGWAREGGAGRGRGVGSGAGTRETGSMLCGVPRCRPPPLGRRVQVHHQSHNSWCPRPCDCAHTRC